MKLIKKNQSILITGVLFLIFSFFLSVFSHFNLQTNAFDLGVFAESVKNLKSFNATAINTVRIRPTLGDHFSPILFIPAIISKIIPFLPISVVLLFLQSFTTFIGGVAFGILGKDKLNERWGLFFQFFFYSFMGIQNALTFDFHEVVIATGLYPLLFLFLEKEKPFLLTLIYALILICKEDQGFILFTFLFLYYVFKKRNKKYLLLSIFALIFSFIEIYYIIPTINPSGYGYQKFYEKNIGFELLFDLVLNLGKYLQIIVNNEKKVFFINYGFLAGGFSLIFSPFLIPTIFFLLLQKHLTKNCSAWDLSFHYSAIFAPFLTLSLLNFVNKASRFFQNITENKKLVRAFLKKCNAGSAMLSGFFVCTIILNFFIYESPYIKKLGQNLDIIFSRKSLLAKDIKTDIFPIIKSGETVSLQSNLVPHFLEKNKVFLFPYGLEEAKYIILSTKNTREASYFWPIAPEERNAYIAKLSQSPDWKVSFLSQDYIVFEKV